MPTFPLLFQIPEPGKYVLPVKVEDAVERKPLRKPSVVEVALPYETGVNGNICDKDEEEILLLKVVQSAEVRKPLVDALAA